LAIIFINGESQYNFVKESYISEPNFVHVSILRIASKGRGGSEPLTTGSSGNLTSFFFFLLLSWLELEPELILLKLRAKNWLATFLGLRLEPEFGLRNDPGLSSAFGERLESLSNETSNLYPQFF
jgi:hypothetical protein